MLFLKYFAIIGILEFNNIIFSGSTVHELEYGDGPEGPSHWPGLCTTGTRQSPIDISPDSVIPAIFSDLKFTNYGKQGDIEILNLGETCKSLGYGSFKFSTIFFQCNSEVSINGILLSLPYPAGD